MSYLDIVANQLEIDEGRRPLMYTDSRGNATVGVGHNMAVPLSTAAINQIKADDLAIADRAARNIFLAFDDLTDARKAVLVNMAFNLGQAALMTFTTFINLVDAGDYDEAADDLATTLWHKQVGARALRLEQAMRDG